MDLRDVTTGVGGSNRRRPNSGSNAIGFAATARLLEPDAEKPASVAADRQLPKGKQTTLGLYVTAAQAYEKWKAAPDKVKIIDVRTPEEYAFIGHPEMAWDIPLAFVTYQRKDGKTEYGPKMNSDFVAEVKEIAGPDRHPAAHVPVR